MNSAKALVQRFLLIGCQSPSSAPANNNAAPNPNNRVARTAPGWSLLLRAPANLPPAPGYQAYEGLLEADRWFGPLITNFQLTRTDIPVEFAPDFPLLQVQVLPRAALDEPAQNGFVVTDGLPSFAPEDWDDYYDNVIRPHVQEHRPRGQYAAAARKRKKGEGSEA